MSRAAAVAKAGTTVSRKSPSTTTISSALPIATTGGGGSATCPSAAFRRGTPSPGSKGPSTVDSPLPSTPSSSGRLRIPGAAGGPGAPAVAISGQATTRRSPPIGCPPPPMHPPPPPPQSAAAAQIPFSLDEHDVFDQILSSSTPMPPAQLNHVTSDIAGKLARADDRQLQMLAASLSRYFSHVPLQSTPSSGMAGGGVTGGGAPEGHSPPAALESTAETTGTAESLLRLHQVLHSSGGGRAVATAGGGVGGPHHGGGNLHGGSGTGAGGGLHSWGSGTFPTSVVKPSVTPLAQVAASASSLHMDSPAATSAGGALFVVGPGAVRASSPDSRSGSGIAPPELVGITSGVAAVRDGAAAPVGTAVSPALAGSGGVAAVGSASWWHAHHPSSGSGSGGLAGGSSTSVHSLHHHHHSDPLAGGLHRHGGMRGADLAGGSPAPLWTKSGSTHNDKSSAPGVGSSAQAGGSVVNRPVPEKVASFPPDLLPPPPPESKPKRLSRLSRRSAFSDAATSDSRMSDVLTDP